MNNYRKVFLLGSFISMSALMWSCYDEFDPNSYKPAFTISGFESSEEIEAENLVAYFPFDGSLSEVKSSSAADNTATSFSNAFKNQGLSLNVANQSYVVYEPGDLLTNLESFTISFWVNPTFVDENTDNGIDGILGFVNISNPNDFWGYLDWFVENGSNKTAAKIVVHVKNNNGGDTWFNIPNITGLFDTWSNHTLTYDATTEKFNYYINAANVIEVDAGWDGPLSFENSGPMVFGAVHFQTTPTLSNHGSEPWASWLTGSMDEIRIYDTALDQEEINALTVLQGKGK
jgi:hypothetical protein